VPAFGEEEVRRWVEGRLEWAAQGKSRPFSVLLKKDGALVGHAGLLLDWDNEKAGLYYWMGVPYWGRGYATEAARELVEQRVVDADLVEQSLVVFLGDLLREIFGSFVGLVVMAGVSKLLDEVVAVDVHVARLRLWMR